MSEAEHLADALTGLFTREENGWFTPFSAAINGLTAEQAAKQPTEGFNSIWQITNHLIYWHEIILRRLQGDLSDITGWSEHYSWPPMGESLDENRWSEAFNQAIALNAQVGEIVASMTYEQLEEPIAPGKAKRWQVIQGLIAHNAYHTNEIISVRHMQGLWLEQV